MAHRNLPRPAAVYGIDIGKNIFHFVGLSCDGTPVQKGRFRRDTLLQFFTRADPSIVGMESCAGSQWLARKIQALGHKVRLIPAQFVKHYVKLNKNATRAGDEALRSVLVAGATAVIRHVRRGRGAASIATTVGGSFSKNATISLRRSFFAQRRRLSCVHTMELEDVF